MLNYQRVCRNAIYHDLDLDENKVFLKKHNQYGDTIIPMVFLFYQYVYKVSPNLLVYHKLSHSSGHDLLFPYADAAAWTSTLGVSEDVGHTVMAMATSYNW